MKNQRGSILVEVMVIGAVTALIAASLMRMTLFRSQMEARTAKVIKEKRDDQAALAQVLAAWNGTVCASNSAVACSGSAGTCGCTCTVKDKNGATVATVATQGSSGNCQLTITSQEAP